MTGSESNPQQTCPRVAAVTIGRNEGERLRRCLASMKDQFDHIVYVDSGSTDDSLNIARKAGVQIVELDLTIPFTAARARNAGFSALQNSDAEFDFVQFVDGDCALRPEWKPAAVQALLENSNLGIVTGWRSEIHRGASIYNALCDFEWRRPAGDIQTCGGDMMVRRTAFQEVDGFNNTVIAAEDDEFCVRMRDAGWHIRRLPVEMTMHDADMHSFTQWWRRAVRSGHGFAQVGNLHSEYFTKERLRVWFFGFLLPAIAALGSMISLWVPFGVALVYLVSYLRTVRGLQSNGLPISEAVTHSLLLSLSKFPNLIGILTFWWRQLRGHSMRLIEYK
ncbi:MAG: glycosyltransferase family 2 protein [Pseudomonadota bacterium]